MPNMKSIINNHNKKLLHPHMTKIYHATAETSPIAQSMESAEQSPSSTKHPAALPTHPPTLFWLLQN